MQLILICDYCHQLCAAIIQFDSVTRYGIEQEYTLLQKDVNWPLGWPVGGFPAPQVWI